MAVQSEPRMEYFEDSESHLLAELRRIDILVQARVRSARELQHADPQLQGLYVSDAEVDRLLDNSSGLPQWASEPLREDFQMAVDRASQRISQLADASETRGIVLRVRELTRAFNLSRLDIDILLIALAPELDLRYERLYAFLHDDVTRKFATVDLALNLLCRSMKEKLAVRARFEPRASLLLHSLIELREDPANLNLSLLAKTLKADSGIVDFLAGGAIPDPRLHPVARMIEPVCSFTDLLLAPDHVRGLLRFNGEPGVLHFQGPQGAGKKSCAEAMCSHRGVRLIIASGSQLASSNDFDAKLRLLQRDCQLHRAFLFVDEFDSFLDETKRLTTMGSCAQLPVAQAPLSLLERKRGSRRDLFSGAASRA